MLEGEPDRCNYFTRKVLIGYEIYGSHAGSTPKTDEEPLKSAWKFAPSQRTMIARNQ